MRRRSAVPTVMMTFFSSLLMMALDLFGLPSSSSSLSSILLGDDGTSNFG